MDSTYKTNRYKMPLFEITVMMPCNHSFVIVKAFMLDEFETSYRWVLQKLKNLLSHDVHPTAIVTDRELGLMRFINDIFI